MLAGEQTSSRALPADLLGDFELGQTKVADLRAPVFVDEYVLRLQVCIVRVSAAGTAEIWRQSKTKKQQLTTVDYLGSPGMQVVHTCTEDKECFVVGNERNAPFATSVAMRILSDQGNETEGSASSAQRFPRATNSVTMARCGMRVQPPTKRTMFGWLVRERIDTSFLKSSISRSSVFSFFTATSYGIGSTCAYRMAEDRTEKMRVCVSVPGRSRRSCTRWRSHPLRSRGCKAAQAVPTRFRTCYPSPPAAVGILSGTKKKKKKETLTKLFYESTSWSAAFDSSFGTAGGGVAAAAAGKVEGALAVAGEREVAGDGILRERIGIGEAALGEIGVGERRPSPPACELRCGLSAVSSN